jgi:hypothetical protein
MARDHNVMADCLVATGSDGVSLELLRLAVPMEVLAWRSVRDPRTGDAYLSLGTRESVERLRVRAEDLLSGSRVELELAPDGLRHVDPAGGAALRLEQDLSQAHAAIRLTAEHGTWSPGLWLVDLELRAEGAWGWRAPTNTRGDSFSWLLEPQPGMTDAAPRGLALPGAVATFGRLHAALQRCFALPCWQGHLDRLVRYWRRVARQPEERADGPPWPELLPLAFVEPPPDAAEGWLPLRSLWDVFPNWLSQPGATYAVLDGNPRPDAPSSDGSPRSPMPGPLRDGRLAAPISTSCSSLASTIFRRRHGATARSSSLVSTGPTTGRSCWLLSGTVRTMRHREKRCLAPRIIAVR